MKNVFEKPSIEVVELVTEVIAGDNADGDLGASNLGGED